MSEGRRTEARGPRFFPTRKRFKGATETAVATDETERLRYHAST